MKLENIFSRISGSSLRAQEKFSRNTANKRKALKQIHSMLVTADIEDFPFSQKERFSLMHKDPGSLSDEQVNKLFSLLKETVYRRENL